MAKPRSNKLEKAERLQVTRLLLKVGRDYTEVVLALVQQYGITERQAKRYIQEARELQAKDPDMLLSDTELAMMRANHIYQNNVGKNDALALMALKMEMELRKEYRKYGSTRSSAGTRQGISPALARALSEAGGNEPMASPDT